MARAVPETFHKRLGKFESFLKRALKDEKAVERIRAYEACIVVWEKEKYGFKFMVLGDECIYLTENPPKTIQEAVPFKDVVSVEHVNDYPDFLSGEQRLNTQHISVTFMTHEPLKGKRGKNDKSPHSSMQDISQGGNNNNPPIKTSLFKSISDGLFRRAKSPRSEEVREERLSSSSPVQKPTFSTSFDEDVLDAMKQDDDSEDEDKELHSSGELHMSKSMPTMQLKKLKLGSNDLKEQLKTNRVNSPVPSSTRPLPALRNTDSPGPDGNKKTGPLYEIHNKAPERKRSLESDRSVPSRKSSSRSSNSDTENLGLIPKIDISDVEDEAFGEKLDEAREAELHIYILNLHSPMLMLIKSAWENHKMRGTFLLDENYSLKTMPSPRRSAMDSEKLVLLFGQLKRELFSANSMEEVFRLMQELKTATEKNMALKKFFWKSSDLFNFIVHQLQKYLPKSPHSMQGDKARTQRADEFELVVLLVDTLALMFRETEILPTRLQCLKSGKGKASVDLMTVLTCLPEVPQKYKPPSSKAAALLMTSQADQWKCLADAEISQLVTEFTDMAAVVLFELMVIAKNANWEDKEDAFFNISWMMKILEKMRTTEKFIERVTTSALHYIAPSKRVELTPQEAVLVFQQFYVLQTFIKYNEPIATYIRNNYTEEFKYFVQAPVIAEKLPKHYPITEWAVSLIEQVTSHVLEKKVRLQ
ncbi:uncharacterized protein C12orf56 isoform X2 [Lingula anatina]|uniref:Uncharacterized protein C12orf56 isoform X2 n=1 Tax=Lingula anatina TaxID=7574 RepID=A0A1S3H4D4_LINAN|nr:uncharacterized protein C12orf56 isoform X2 [Lingula anatina]|eukprot:XP_013379999.1 uncharacterized protein C12orf56 isoform X2 [Lingula anatina]